MQDERVIVFGEALIDRLGPPGGDPSADFPVIDCFGGAPANVACEKMKKPMGSSYSIFNLCFFS